MGMLTTTHLEKPSQFSFALDVSANAMIQQQQNQDTAQHGTTKSIRVASKRL